MSYKCKKASLSLSINAIVILILAISMLGLGLAFMRGVFTQMGSKVGEITNIEGLTNPPTADNVLTLAPSDITLRNDKSEEITVAFLNTAGTRNCGLKSPITAPAGTNVADLIYSYQTVSMVTDQINTWLVSVKAKAYPTAGTGVYTFVMECPAGTEIARKDIVVTVTS